MLFRSGGTYISLFHWPFPLASLQKYCILKSPKIPSPSTFIGPRSGKPLFGITFRVLRPLCPTIRVWPRGVPVPAAGRQLTSDSGPPRTPSVNRDSDSVFRHQESILGRRRSASQAYSILFWCRNTDSLPGVCCRSYTRRTL